MFALRRGIVYNGTSSNEDGLVTFAIKLPLNKNETVQYLIVHNILTLMEGFREEEDVTSILYSAAAFRNSSRSHSRDLLTTTFS